MGKRILVGVDDSEQADAALEFVVSEWPTADLVLISVIDPAASRSARGAGVPSGSEAWYERAKTEATALVDSAAERVGDDDRVDTVTTVGKPASSIVAYATDHDVDHVVVGSHGRHGISRVVLGSVAEAVVRTSPVPVTVVR